MYLIIGCRLRRSILLTKLIFEEVTKGTNVEPCMVTHACNLGIQETEAGRSRVRGQPGLHSHSKIGLDYTVKLCLKKTKLNTSSVLSQPL